MRQDDPRAFSPYEPQVNRMGPSEIAQRAAEIRRAVEAHHQRQAALFSGLLVAGSIMMALAIVLLTWAGVAQ
jgi:hypothetical protein